MTHPLPGGAAATPATLEPLGHPAATPSGGGRLESLLDMMLPVTIEFGRTSLTVQEVLDLSPGAVIQLDRLVGEAVDIYVSDRRLAEGEVVVIGERFGIRVLRLLPAAADGSVSGAGR